MFKLKNVCIGFGFGVLFCSVLVSTVLEYFFRNWSAGQISRRQQNYAVATNFSKFEIRFLNSNNCTIGLKNIECKCSLNYEGKTCEFYRPCLSTPCQNNASCGEGVNGVILCNCASGFEGTYCAENIDDCVGVVCENGGQCIDLVNAIKCRCVSGYTGVKCENDHNECSSNPCVNGRCLNKFNKFVCKCFVGFGGVLCSIRMQCFRSNFVMVTKTYNIERYIKPGLSVAFTVTSQFVYVISGSSRCEFYFNQFTLTHGVRLKKRYLLLRQSSCLHVYVKLVCMRKTILILLTRYSIYKFSTNTLKLSTLLNDWNVKFLDMVKIDNYLVFLSTEAMIRYNLSSYWAEIIATFKEKYTNLLYCPHSRHQLFLVEKLSFRNEVKLYPASLAAGNNQSSAPLISMVGYLLVNYMFSAGFLPLH